MPRGFSSGSAPFDKISLAQIDIRHLALEPPKPLFDSRANLLAENQLSPQRGSHGVTSQVVLSRPQASGQDNDFDVLDGMLNGLRQARAIVADNNFPPDLDADGIELLSDV